MPSQNAKPAGSRPVKSQMRGVSSRASVSAPESRPNTASKPNSLLGSTVASVTAEMRRAMIAEAAYYIAEQRGFGSGREVEDWLLAERQIEAAHST